MRNLKFKPEVYVFWQNILSIHQAAFIRELAEMYHVILVAEKRISENREKLGWSVPDFGKASIVVAPSEADISELLDKPGAVHCFSGINAFPIPWMAFRQAVRRKLPVGVMSEPFNYTGWKGVLRFAMYRWLSLKFDRNISFLLITGLKGRWCFEKAGFEKSRIFDWGYFAGTQRQASRDESGKMRIIFVGSIEERKNILALARAFRNIDDPGSELLIIGAGPLESELETATAGAANISYIKKIDNNGIGQYMADADLLVLPSLWDGWGAVVNEALVQGTPVLASDHCGASVLLDGKLTGTVFPVKGDGLETALRERMSRGKTSREERDEIAAWAAENISGKAAAGYFASVMDYAFQGQHQGQKPIAPWMKREVGGNA